MPNCEDLLSGGERLRHSAPFNEAALALFASQYDRNEPYGEYCRRLGRTPAAVQDWTEIPAVPTDAFKRAPLAVFNPAEAARVFMTSGTSAGTESRGKVYKDEAAMRVHDEVVRRGFRRWCLPDLDRILLLVLAPPEETVPHLRMAHDCSLFLRDFGADGVGHFLGEAGLAAEALADALRKAESTGEPVMLVGATFSFVRFFDLCLQTGWRFALPSGSRMADGGGYKGRSRELTKAEFLETCGQLLGLPAPYCVNLLGITELTSLFFDNVLAEAVQGGNTARYKTNAPWTRTRAVDPATLELLPAGKIGLLRHWDLANVASVVALQTDDLGMQVEDGFEVLGRASGAELRGCSLAMESFLETHPTP